MKEEDEEYLQAVQDNDLTKITDDLSFMLYIINGIIIEQGFKKKLKSLLLKFIEVIRAN